MPWWRKGHATVYTCGENVLSWEHKGVPKTSLLNNYSYNLRGIRTAGYGCDNIDFIALTSTYEYEVRVSRTRVPLIPSRLNWFTTIIRSSIPPQLFVGDWVSWASGDERTWLPPTPLFRFHRQVFIPGSYHIYNTAASKGWPWCLHLNGLALTTGLSPSATFLIGAWATMICIATQSQKFKAVQRACKRAHTLCNGYHLACETYLPSNCLRLWVTSLFFSSTYNLYSSNDFFWFPHFYTSLFNLSKI